MKKFIRNSSVMMALLLLTSYVHAQRFNEGLNDYSDVSAVMLQKSGDTYFQTKLERVVVALPNYSNQLNVRLIIPYSSLPDGVPDDSITASPGYFFNLKIRVDSWNILESVTSDKTIDTDGYLTLNHITKLVIVEYTPLPSVTSQEGGFNINLIVGFNPDDFNLGDGGMETRFFIKIGDAPVNRL